MKQLIALFSSILGIPESAIIPTISQENTPEWDSLNAIILLTEIEKEFEMKFTFDEEAKIKNFGDVVELIRAKGGVL